MPNPTIPAVDGAMPANGHDKTLLDIEDEINDVRQLIEAAWMAASDLLVEHGNPMQALLSMLSDKLTTARDGLSAFRMKEPAND